MLRFFANIWPFTYLFYKKVVAKNRVEIIATFQPPETLKIGDYIYNPEFYATEDCAESVMRRFNAQVMFLKPIIDTDRSAPAQWFVRFVDGLEVNAGQLARYFALYPEEESRAAAQLAIELILALRQEKWAKEKDDVRE